MVGGLPRQVLLFVELEEVGGVAQVAFFAFTALVLDVAQQVESLLELAGEARAIETEDGNLLYGGPGVVFAIGASCRGEDIGLEQRDAVEPPGSVGQFLDELGLGGIGGLVLVAELAAVGVVVVLMFGRNDGCARGKAVPYGVTGRTAFSGCSARAGGSLRIACVDGSAVDGNSGGRMHRGS